MADNLNSDNPGIVDDTSDGDLGANRGEPEYGSLAESERRDRTGDLAGADINSTDPDGGADAGADRGADTGAGRTADVDGGADADAGARGDRGAGVETDSGEPTLARDPDHGADGGADAGAGGFAV